MAKTASAINVQSEDDMARAAAPTATSILSKFKIVDLKRSAQVVITDPVMRARRKLADGVAEQIKYVESELKGETFAPTRFKYVTAEDGRRVREEAPKKRMIWYWQQGGRFYTEVRYGSSPLNLGSGSAIDCGTSLTDVIEILNMVVEASESGELDEELRRVAAQRSRHKEVPAPTPATPGERLAARSTRR